PMVEGTPTNTCRGASPSSSCGAREQSASASTSPHTAKLVLACTVSDTSIHSVRSVPTTSELTRIPTLSSYGPTRSLMPLALSEKGTSTSDCPALIECASVAPLVSGKESHGLRERNSLTCSSSQRASLARSRPSMCNVTLTE
ncbi:MAG: hypothetical protein SGPRY_013484, partial [Prymnesium sp.]